MANVAVTGAPRDAGETLSQLMLTRPGGLFRKHRLNRALLDQDVVAIVNFLQARGWIDTRVDSVVIDVDQEKHEAAIEIHVVPGVLYQVDSLSFAGAVVWPDSTLRQWIQTQPGRPYDSDILRSDAERLMLRYMQAGWLMAEITPRAVPDTVRHTVAIVFNITEKLKAHVRDIEIRGLEVTRPQVILRDVTLKKGDIFNYAKMIQTQSRLYRTGLFRRVDVFADPADSTRADRMLVVRVTEREAGEFAVGLGYSTEEHGRGSVLLAHQNFRGRAQTVSGAIRASWIEQRSEYSFSEPRLLKSEYALSVGVHGENRVEPSFAHQRVGAGVTLGRHFTTHLYMQLGQHLEFNWLSDVDLDLIESQRTGKTGTVSRLEGSLTYDTRDDYFTPNRGWLILGQSEVAGLVLQGSTNYWRLQTDVRRFLACTSWLTLAVRYHVGQIVGLRSTRIVPLQERFLLGGVQNLRGYDRNRVGPRDSEGNFIGGNTIMHESVEARIPLVFRLACVVFFDAGNVWRDAHEITLRDVRGGYGAGLRIMTPLGAVGMDYGRKVAPRGDEGPDAWHVAVGFTF